MNKKLEAYAKEAKKCVDGWQPARQNTLTMGTVKISKSRIFVVVWKDTRGFEQYSVCPERREAERKVEMLTEEWGEYGPFEIREYEQV